MIRRRWMLALPIAGLMAACQAAPEAPPVASPAAAAPAPGSAVVVVSHEGKAITPLARCGEACAEPATATPASDFFQRYAANASTYTAQVAILAPTSTVGGAATGAASRPLTGDAATVTPAPSDTPTARNATPPPATGTPAGAAVSRSESSTVRGSGSLLGPLGALLDVPKVTTVPSATPKVASLSSTGTGTPAPTVAPTITSIPTATVGAPAKPPRPSTPTR